MILRFLIPAMWAGVIALDFTGCGPFMISQPMVCGPIFGWLLGRVSVGIILGGIVQLIWMDVTPVGVGIPFDTTAVTLLSVYMATLAPHESLSQIILALLIAVPFGFFFRLMDFYARRLNTLIVRRIDRVNDDHLPTAITLGIVGGLVWSWLRYAGFYALSMGVAQQIWSRLAYSPRMTWIDQGLTMAVILLPMAGMGVALELFLLEDPEGRLTSLRHLRLPGRRRGDSE